MRISDWSSDVCSADLFRFSRRSLRALTGWGDTQLKVHLGRLADLEYVLIHRMKVGQGYEYELLYDGEGEDGGRFVMGLAAPGRSEEHTSELQSLMRISYAVFCLKKKQTPIN